MQTEPLNRKTTIENLGPEWPQTLLPEIRQHLQTSGRKLVVLDDDPTGTQTVYDIPVLTEWSVATLTDELLDPAPACYLLTNSRSLPLPQAVALNQEIAQNLMQASTQCGRSFAVVSRSDSTLRGHYPGEVDALQAALGQAADGVLLIPYFLEGGRLTIGDVHYVAEGDVLTPAAATPFAQDAAFGYTHSNLKDWVEEKTAGRIRAVDVASVSMADIRGGGPAAVAEKLMQLSDGAVCVINAVTMRDVEVFVAGLLQAEAAGKQFLYRTAASFVQVRAGLAPRPLLTKEEFNLSGSRGGLFVAGSYVPKTTAQLKALLAQTAVQPVEIDVEILLDDGRQQGEIDRATAALNVGLAQGSDMVLYTSRNLITADDAETSLAIGQRVSDSLVRIVHGLENPPRYLIAKGGITSSDVATHGLGIKRAIVMGQILPGVPVWRTGEESRYPGMAYVVFPGNVGDTDALVQAVRILT